MVKSKTLPAPMTLNYVQDEEQDRQTDAGKVEMKELVSINEKNVYYFDAASNLGTVILFLFVLTKDVVTGYNDIHEDDFPNHVKMMHQDRDNKFELEYEVRQGIESSMKVHYHQFLSFYVVTGQVDWCTMRSGLSLL